MQRNVFAYTAPCANLPPYVSLNVRDGQYELTVHDEAGSQVMVPLPYDAVLQFTQGLVTELTNKA